MAITGTTAEYGVFRGTFFEEPNCLLMFGSYALRLFRYWKVNVLYEGIF